MMLGGLHGTLKLGCGTGCLAERLDSEFLFGAPNALSLLQVDDCDDADHDRYSLLYISLLSVCFSYHYNTRHSHRHHIADQLISDGRHNPSVSCVKLLHLTRDGHLILKSTVPA